jgi:enterochelin esterase family protein
MTKTTLAAFSVMIIVLVGVSSKITFRATGSRSIREPEEGFDSPRLAALVKELNAGNQAALDRFWKELQGKAPLLEPVENNSNRSWITFVWRGDGRTRRVNVQGGPATGDFANWMKRLGDTDLWYRTDQVPNDSRFAYFFQVNRPLKFPPHAEKLPPLAPPHADPLNPRKAASPDASLAELPDAPPQPWLRRRPEVAQGTLYEQKIISQILRDSRPGFDHERRFVVYTPPHYEPQGEPYALLVLFDGPFGTSDMPVAVILDNLIASGRVRPLVGVFVYQSSERLQELGCSTPFSDFVARELVPWVRAHFRIRPEPTGVTIGGVSAGGRMAAYCGLRHSEVFGNVLSLSGGFEWWPGALEEQMDEEPGWLTRQFVTNPRVPVRFYLGAGCFEHWFFPSSLLTENRRLRDVLQAKGYAVDYREFSGGHHPVSWRGSFVDGLIALANRQPQEEESR